MNASDVAAEYLQRVLSGISTSDLIHELSTRDNISCYVISDEEAYLIQKTNVENRVETIERYHGPIKIITVVE